MAKRPTPTKQQRDLAIKEITRLMREIALSSDKQQENELRHQLAPTSFLLTIKRLQIIRDTLIEEYKNNSETVEKIYNVFPNLDGIK
tara:strand:- start:60 stop:320 length:261 start_codon:yes stop_codon:yes gene_type:complete